MDVTAAGGFPRLFNDLPDPQGVNRIHKLQDMIVIAVMAVICGADGWTEVAWFGRSKRKGLATFLELPGGWLVTIDGKSIRRSFEHAWDKRGMAHRVSARVCQGGNRRVFGQVAVEDKSNEITTIPRLLELPDLSAATGRWRTTCTGNWT